MKSFNEASKSYPVISVGRNERLPLSFAQQRLWFLAQMEGGSAAYHIPSGLRLAGNLNRAALRQALDRIVMRHEVLRTTFVLIDGEPAQRISPAQDSPFSLLEHDLREHKEAERGLDRYVAEEAAAPFDLQSGPLIRGRLICLGECDHVLLITTHHIISDGWSMGVLINELSTLYSSYLREEADPLPPLGIQYADYAVWQRQWIQGDVLQRQAEYWKSTLADAPALLELPADHPRPAQQSYAGAFAELLLDKQLTSGLKQLSRRHRTTMFMTLMAAWSILLARLSGQRAVLVGSPTADRGRTEIRNLIGFFVNTVALRVDLSAGPTVSELLAQVKAQTIAAQHHQDIPFEQVVELINPVRSLAHSPLIQVMFAWQNIAGESPQMPGLELHPVRPSPHRMSRFDLTLELEDKGEIITGGIEYAASLFEPPTIQRYLGYFRNLLEAMVADDTQIVDRLPMLPAQERHQLLYDWNDTRTEYPADKCIHELFEAQVLESPDAVAVVFEAASLSYEELNARANQLAHRLRQLGVVPDSRVAICAERSLEMIVALLAVLKAGGAYVPLDPEYPAERLSFMLEDSAPVVLLTQGHLRDLVAHPSLPVLCLEEDATWQVLPETNLDRAGLSPEHLAYIIYTSGSTGTPKGVMVEHRGVVNRLVWMQAAYGLNASDVVLQKTPFSFDVSVWEFFAPLLTGARLVLARPEGHKDPAYLMEQIGNHGITTMHFVPSMLQTFLGQVDEPNGLASLRCVVCSGESLSPTLVQRFRERLSWTALENLYGPTEASIDVTAWSCDSTPMGSIVPIGRPIWNTQIYLLDEYGQPVPIGVSGELHIGGAGVARGYLNRPELTAERFVRDSFAAVAGARMYRTGDLGRWLPDGSIEFLGRNDFQVKVRGFRIELGEIEARLAEVGGVREAAVIAREDTAGDKRLVAYYTAAEMLAVEELRSHLASGLPEYMVPTAYVRLDSLPLTVNGKLDHRALRAPENDAYATAAYEQPQGEIETSLASTWAELLKVDLVGRHDNFFALGGHSLLMMQLASRLRSEFQVEIPMRALLNGPTIVDMTVSIAVGQLESASREESLQELTELSQMSLEHIRDMLKMEAD